LGQLHLKYLIVVTVSVSSLLILNTAAQRGALVPSWVREGADLEYRAYISGIDFFYNEFSIPRCLMDLEGATLVGKNSSMAGLVFQSQVESCLSLAVEEMNETFAILNATLRVASYTCSTNLMVNISSREVFSPDGAYLGQTTVWISSIEQGRVLPFVGKGDSTVYVDCINSSFPIDTSEGPQDTIILRTLPEYEKGVEYKGILRSSRIAPFEAQTVEHFHPREDYYDADTLVLIEGNISEDAILSAFGIINLIGYASLVYTNIDLGPPNLLPILIRLCPYIILFLILTFACVRVLGNRRILSRFGR
jgi:hypothetical protein